MTESKKVLVLDPAHARLFQGLEEMGYEMAFMQDASVSEVMGGLPEAQGLILRSRFQVDADFLANAKELKWIARYGVGLDHIDLELCRSKGIHVFNAKGGNANAGGEHVIGLLLNLLRNQSKADREVRKGQWVRQANRGHELGSRTLGIIGFGHTGQALARLAKSFGTKILAFDKYVEVDMVGVESASLAEIQHSADLLSFHVPLTEETHHYFDEDFLGRMKNPFILINASRGAVVETAALLRGITSGQITAAGLDVLEEEDEDLAGFHMSESIERLMETGKVIFTSHIGGWTFQSFQQQADILLHAIRSLE